MSLIENLLGERCPSWERWPSRLQLQRQLHGYSPALVRTVMGMVNVDPRKRPTASDICGMEGWEERRKSKARRFSI